MPGDFTPRAADLLLGLTLQPAAFGRRVWWGQVGRPFQGTNKALHVEPGPGLAGMAHYIHLNPVRAKLVRAERLLQPASFCQQEPQKDCYL